MRLNNISVCILRSRLNHDATDARLGALTTLFDGIWSRPPSDATVVTEDNVEQKRVPPSKTGINQHHADPTGAEESGDQYPLRSHKTKSHADEKQTERVKPTTKRRRFTQKDRKAFDEEDQPLNATLAGDWAIPRWANVASFKKWWDDVTVPVVGGTVWPVECSASKAHPHLIDKTEHYREMRAFSSLKGDPSLAELTVELDFAILVGGTGSPPHVDSISNLLSRHQNAEGHDDWNVELTLAVGYLIQGYKYFWALPPRGDQVRNFLDYHRRNVPVGLTSRQQSFRADILTGTVPHPFQGNYSMGWSSEAEWRAMAERSINTHVHQLLPGDIYIVTDGTFHAVFNSVRYQPASAAHDDTWSHGRPTLGYLIAKKGSQCPD